MRSTYATLFCAITLASVLLPREAFCGQVIVDNTFGHGGALTGPNYAIGAGLGKRFGSNLFQSFSTFNLDKGDVATFTAPAHVTNILARVTGGSASNIDGTIAMLSESNSNAPRPANFYLINPAGVIFGPDASLDVGGSFIVTTANSVRLGDGPAFDASASSISPILKTTAPAGFGFLTPPGPIAINGSTLGVTPSHGIAIVGGAIQITGGTLSAPAGTVQLISAASAGNVIAGPGKTIDTAGLRQLGTITLSAGASVDCTGPRGGEIAVRAGDLSLTDSQLAARTSGDGTGRGIDIDLSGQVNLLRSAIDTRTSGNGTAGEIALTADSVTVNGQTPSGLSISSGSTGPDNRGRGGNIAIEANALTFTNGGFLSTDARGQGKGGDIVAKVSGTVVISGATALGNPSGLFANSQSDAKSGDAGSVRLTAAELQVLDGAEITSVTTGLGDGGGVNVKVSGQAILSGTDVQGNPATISANSQSPSIGGNAGTIRLTVESLEELGGASIASSTFGTGRGGDITVKVSGSALLSGEDAAGFSSGIDTNTMSDAGGGSAGRISFDARSLQLLNGAEIASATLGSGRGGHVAVSASGMAIFSGSNTTGNSGVFANTQSATGGAAGSIDIRAAALQLTDGGEIVSDSFGLGNGGDIALHVGGQALFSGENSQGSSDSGVFADTNSSVAGGHAGRIELRAGSLQMLGGAEVTSSTSGLGRGGDIRVDVLGRSILAGTDAQGSDTEVAANTESTAAGGDAGTIDFRTRSLMVSGGADIGSQTYGLGNGGDILLNVSGQAILSGQDALGFTSGVAADSNSDDAGGRAGAIRLRAANLQVLGGAEISSTTFGLGNGGDITVNVSGRTFLSGVGAQGTASGMFANTQSESGGGTAGAITCKTGSLQITDGAAISSQTFGLGGGGNVSVNVAGQASLTSDGGVFADTLSDGAGGPAGSIRFSARNLQVLGGAKFSSQSAGGGNGGDITVSVSDRAIFSGQDAGGADSAIATNTHSADAGGHAGRISFSAGTAQLLDGGVITSSTLGSGAAGNVSIGVDSLLLGAASSIASSSSGSGNAGGVQIFASRGIVLNQNSVITASSQFSNAGDVQIFSSATTTLLDSFITAEAAGSGGNISLGSRTQLHLTDSEVTTSAGSTGGNITLSAPQFIRVNNSLVATTSTTANGGNIRIDPLELSLSNGSQISANGNVNGGNITILADAKPGVVLTGPLAQRNVTATGATGTSGSVAAGVFDAQLAGSLIPLSSPLATSIGLAPQCGVQFGDNQSTFVITGRGGTPEEPGGWLPDLKFQPSNEKRSSP